MPPPLPDHPSPPRQCYPPRQWCCPHHLWVVQSYSGQSDVQYQRILQKNNILSNIQFYVCGVSIAQVTSVVAADLPPVSPAGSTRSPGYWDFLGEYSSPDSHLDAASRHSPPRPRPCSPRSWPPLPPRCCCCWPEHCCCGKESSEERNTSLNKYTSIRIICLCLLSLYSLMYIW